MLCYVNKSEMNDGEQRTHFEGCYCNDFWTLALKRTCNVQTMISKIYVYWHIFEGLPWLFHETAKKGIVTEKVRHRKGIVTEKVSTLTVCWIFIPTPFTATFNNSCIRKKSSYISISSNISVHFHIFSFMFGISNQWVVGSVAWSHHEPSFPTEGRTLAYM